MRGPTSGAAPATISSPRRERSSRTAFDERVERLVADRVRLGEVDDQPAHAAGQGGVDAALELRRVAVVERALEIHLVDDVVEPLLPDREVAGADHRAQGLRGEHDLSPNYPLSRTFNDHSIGQ